MIFFFNDTATTEIYTLSLHDALPISSTAARCGPARRTGSPSRRSGCPGRRSIAVVAGVRHEPRELLDRKSTRLNSSHANISYAVFCLKKKIIHLTFSGFG